MVDVLHGYTPAAGDWGTSTMLIEALAGYDQITPMNSFDNIGEQITEALSDEDDPDHQTVARSIVPNVFEDERIPGPFAKPSPRCPTIKG